MQRLQTQLDQYTDLTPEQETADRAGPAQGRAATPSAAQYLETAQRLKRAAGQAGRRDEAADADVDQLDFEFVLFASATIDYDYIMKLIADFSRQDPPARRR